ncbi:MAG: arginine--tRNA ligase [Eubacterium sp.]|nr:arginine--tRNA ligase [Eubacterium sp.]
MQKIVDMLSEETGKAFEAAGYDKSYAKVSLSNRPDLCDYQCNGAMPLAKQAHKAPIMIAEDIAEKLKGCEMLESVEAAAPGFLNMTLSKAFLAGYINKMEDDENMGFEKTKSPKNIIIDYGGPNVAKPLHVGHLRSAIIGESIKRTGRYVGHKVTGDVHLGDWGLQMGLIITELKERKPNLVYFDDSYEGEYPAEAPFTVSELEEIYPTASGKSKEDEAYKNAALEATAELQGGRRGYQALLSHILNVSVTDLKKNYKNLNVEFDLWLGESDAQPYVPDMIEKMEKDGIAYESEGALVVDVAEESDSKEIPPCIVRKSDGASLYATTDLATLVQRMKDFNPDKVLYVVDKRQDMHFLQVFRTARKAGIVKPETELEFLGFGTMNGKDGKPFKTREGGVMRLEHLIKDINEEMLKKIMDNANSKSDEVDEKKAKETAEIVALSALKYGDLSNQASKNYVFDIDRFTSFEGNTGPYILYTIVRIKSILEKYLSAGKSASGKSVLADFSEVEKGLMLELVKFESVVKGAYEDSAPHKICAYIYDVSNAFNRFYHEINVMGEEDEDKQASYIKMLDLTKRILEKCIDLLGFEAPDKM